MSGSSALHIGEDLQATAAAAADRWEALAAQAIRERGAFHVALAGGSTPRALYRLLAAAPRRERIDWQAVHVWFGDERCVPPDHADSNYHMVQETLLSHLPCAPARVHRMRGEAEPVSAAREYEGMLQQHLPRAERTLAPPRLDPFCSASAAMDTSPRCFRHRDSRRGILARRRRIRAATVGVAHQPDLPCNRGGAAGDDAGRRRGQSRYPRHRIQRARGRLSGGATASRRRTRLVSGPRRAARLDRIDGGIDA